jgi:hypothetical protein
MSLPSISYSDTLNIGELCILVFFFIFNFIAYDFLTFESPIPVQMSYVIM